MLKIEELIEKWNSIEVIEEAFKRVDSTHPLDIYIGCDASGYKELLILTEAKPSKIMQSRSIIVDVGKRNDGKWTLCFKLNRKEHESVYINLCFDLIEASRTQTNKIKGVSFILNRFVKWQRLMEYGNEGLLSEIEKKGLIGELLFLEKYIDDGNEVLTAIDGWIGSEGADRDFVYSDKWYEIKAVDPSATIVHISSVEQLDINEFGELVISFIEKTSQAECNSFTLKNIVDSLRGKFAINIEALIRFDNKLLNVGYIDRNEYNEQHYVCRSVKRYIVNDTFPRIKRSMLPHAVTNLSYELGINALHGWEV